jgi:hypothetical protein
VLASGGGGGEGVYYYIKQKYRSIITKRKLFQNARIDGTSQTVHNDATSLTILFSTLLIQKLLCLFCPLLLAHFVSMNLSLLLDSAFKLTWPPRGWLLLLGTATFWVSDIGTNYLFCPTGGLEIRACVINELTTAFVDIYSSGIQLILLIFVAGAQTNLLDKIRDLSTKEVGNRKPEEFQWIIRCYTELQERTSLYCEI